MEEHTFLHCSIYYIVGESMKNAVSFVSVQLERQMKNPSEAQGHRSLERCDLALRLNFLLSVVSALTHANYLLWCLGVLSCAYLCRWALTVGCLCGWVESMF